MVTDFAFADTVVVDELDEAIPASGIVVSDDTGAERRMTPIVFPPHAPVTLEVRPNLALDDSLLARMRRNMDESRAEMHYLWSATADGRQDRTLVGRIQTLMSFFEWDRADLLRAAWIGLAVFFLAATIGAIVFESGVS
jgi:hypothetical protein